MEAVTVLAPDERKHRSEAHQSGTTQPAGPSRRGLALALGAAVLSLLAAVVAAVGPAHGKHSVYAWPPRAIPAQSPRNGWYAPLALLNRVPASIDIRLPCALSPPLRRDRPVTVLTTTRRSQRSGGFEIVQAGPSLRFLAGRSRLASVPWPASCPLHVSVRDGEVRLPRRAIPLDLDTPGAMPIVTSVFTRLDIRRGEPPQVLVQTRDYATSQTAVQIAAALISVAFACLALVLIAGIRRRRSPLRALGRALRSGWRARHATDAVVVGVLLLWWAIAPTLADDPWYLTRYLNYPSAGGFSLYYDQYGANQPLGFWFEWSEHFLAPYGLLSLRLSSLAFLMAAWLLCRWLVPRSLPASVRTNDLVRWTLAAAFLVGALAWGMTARPEPVISLLTLIVLAAMIVFAAGPRWGPLALVVPVSALALTGHTTGLLATAPVLASAPNIVRMIRSTGRSALVGLAALLLAGGALILVLFTLDADLGTRLEDGRLVRAGGLHSEPPWHEYVRYIYFDGALGATAVRHLSLVLLLLTAAALLTRNRSVHTGVSTLPAASVAVGLVLLAFVPSKWPWHFGALAGLGAVAVAVEVARLMTAARVEESQRLRALVSVLVLTVAASWSWSGLKESTPFDLEKVTWKAGFNVYTLLGTAALVGAIVLFRARRATSDPGTSVGASPGIVVAVVGFSAVFLTGAVVLADTALAPWSPARLNVEAFVHRTSGCGLADHVPNGTEIARRMSEPTEQSMLVPSISIYFPCAKTAAIEGGRLGVPNILGIWYDQWPVSKKDGPFKAATDLHDFRQVTHKRLMRIYLAKPVVPGFRRVSAVLVSSGRK